MNDNDKKDCPCAVCSIGRIIDEKLSDRPKDDEVNEVFRALAVGVAYVAGLNSQPESVVRAFLEHLQYAMVERLAGTEGEGVGIEIVPAPSQMH